MTHPGQGTPVPLAQRGPAVVQKVPSVSALLVRARMDPPQCPVTHVELIPSAWGPSEACAEWGASGRTALSGMYPTRRDPTGHRQAGVTWSTLSGQNCAPTQPVQDLRRHGVSVQQAGNSGQEALCTRPTQQNSGAPEDSCRESHVSWASRGQLRAPGPSSQSSSLMLALWVGGSAGPPHGQCQDRMEPPSLAARGHQAWVGSVL